MPQSSYRFRADQFELQFFSAETNHCDVPECTNATVVALGMQQVEQSQTIDYAYDPLNRLIGASYDDGSSFVYAYDAVGNRVSEINGSEINQYAYDDANRLTSVNGQAYTWDNNGNLLSDGTKNYTYNYANRLTQVVSGTDTYQYLYNGLGDRLQSNLNGTATTYSLDLNSGLTQVLADGTNTYTYGFNRIAQVPLSETQSGYFLGDALGSVRQVVDPQAEILLAQFYSPYGELLSSIGDYATAYSYTGEMTDGTGLVNLRARYYDPGTGRFVSRDTWGGEYDNPITLVKWVYANGNPLKYSDPSGKWSTDNGCCNQEEDCYTRLSRPIQPSSGKLSPKGEAFIKAYELHFVWPYGDAGLHKGYCTIGYGTVLSYPNIKNCSFYDVQKLHDFNVTDQLTGTTKKLNPVKGLSEADIEDYFRREVKIDQDAIKNSITIPLSQNQFDALVSFLYNAGQNKLTNDLWINNYWVKTTYAALINNHQAKTAFYEMIKQSSYVKSTGQFNRSLYFRRYEEKEMYFYNDYKIDNQNDPEPEDYFK